MISMSNRVHVLLLAGAFLSLASSANAAFDCSVKVRAVLIYNDGAVNVMHTGRNDYTTVCNMNQTWKGVSPATCTMWAASLQQIKRVDGNATFYYAESGSCATLPTYQNAYAPIYIGYTQ